MSIDETRAFWESLYGERQQVWSGRVNATLARDVDGVPPGRALDLGCGEGGDALWLAERGWTVTAVDISATAIERARAQAASRGLDVDWQQRDLSAGLPVGPFDLVSAQFFQSPVTLPREQVLRAAADELAPGGLLLVVGHAAQPPWAAHEHRADPALMPSAEEVVTGLALDDRFDVVRSEDVLRPATGPDGQHAELLDSVVLVRRS